MPAEVLFFADAMDELKQLSEKLNIPVTNTLMAKGAFPETNELSLGMLGMHGNFGQTMQ